MHRDIAESGLHVLSPKVMKTDRKPGLVLTSFIRSMPMIVVFIQTQHQSAPVPLVSQTNVAEVDFLRAGGKCVVFLYSPLAN